MDFFFFSYSVDQTSLCLCILFYYKAVVKFASLYHKQNNNLTTVCFSHHTPGLFSQVWCHLAWLRSCQCESVAAVTPLLPSFPLSVFQGFHLPVYSATATWLGSFCWNSSWPLFSKTLYCVWPQVLWASLSPADVPLCFLFLHYLP